MPRRGVSLTRAINQEDLVGGGTTNTTSVPGRETAVAKPQVSDAAKAAQAQVDQASVAMPTIVIPEAPAGDTPLESGSDAAAAGNEGETGDSGATGGGDTGGAGVYASGGMVGGSGSEHPITAQAGEYVINAAAVKKYGLATIEAINRGKANVMQHSEAVAHYAKGGLVGHGSGRFATLESKLQAKGDVKDPAALAAAIGRKKYGTARFARLAHGGH